MRNYYLQHIEDTNINYFYLFLLHKIAVVDKSTRLYNTVKYSSLEELTNRLNIAYNNINKDNKKQVISKTTLSRVLNSDKNGNYFNYDNVNKVITLKNNFTKRQTGGKAKVIILTGREIDFRLIQKSELVTRYDLYIK